MKNDRSGVKKGEKNIYDTKTHDLPARNSSRKDTLRPCGHQPDQYARIRKTGAILRSHPAGSDPTDKDDHRYTTVLVAVFILLGMFSKSYKKKLDDDKKNFTHLSSVHEAKRSLTRVQFHEADKRNQPKKIYDGY